MKVWRNPVFSEAEHVSTAWCLSLEDVNAVADQVVAQLQERGDPLAVERRNAAWTRADDVITVNGSEPIVADRN